MPENNTKAMYKLSYGLFVCTAVKGEKKNGCIINTAMQVASDPNRISIAVNKANFTHDMIKETHQCNISVISQDASFDLFKHFGFQSGRDVDKFKMMNLTPVAINGVKAKAIGESPLSLACRVKEIKELGSHDMFIAEVVGVMVDDKYMRDDGKFELNSSKLVAYSHGEYFGLGKKLGKFGYSVKKQ